MKEYTEDESQYYEKDNARYEGKYCEKDKSKYDSKCCEKDKSEYDGRYGEQSSNDGNDYLDIINLLSPKSKRHPPMPLSNRAAQFAPFSALTGHKEIIKEAARRTGQKATLEEDAIGKLNEKLFSIQEKFPKLQEATITYFIHDKEKEGGVYVTHRKLIRRIDQVAGQMIMKDGSIISLEDIFQIELTKD